MSDGDTVRVTLTISLDVDRKGWAHEYSEQATAAAVRESVKAYIEGQVKNAYPSDIAVWSNISRR